MKIMNYLNKDLKEFKNLALENSLKYINAAPCPHIIIVDLFNVLKSCIFIVWFFYANQLTKQKKVKEMYKLIKLFQIVAGVYILLAVVSLVMQIVWVI